MTQGNTTQLATFGGGCFWCLDAVFRQLKGVKTVVSGYTGGHVTDPTYQDVCGGKTGHAEVIQVGFDPSELSYSDLLMVFFAVHDPTTLNRQGADIGTQYRSAIYTHSPEQADQAKQVIAKLTADHTFGSPIVTEVTPLGDFYAAEDYHQDYSTKNPTQGYCQAVVAPKVAKFRKQFLDKLMK